MAKEQKHISFGKRNLYVLAIGIATIIIGYIFMAQPPVNSFWSLTLAPIVLLIAYLFIIPYSIIHGRDGDGKSGA
jgi:membrane protein YdbS with pleckstrin-like domain